MDEHEHSRPWYAPGLYARIQERRRLRPERAPRKPLWQRLRERGLRWTEELVVGIFVAVVAASLVTLAVVRPGGASHAGQGAAAGSGASVEMTPTPGCIAAPIPGSVKRVCTLP